jgi:hypothetical protein
MNVEVTYRGGHTILLCKPGHAFASTIFSTPSKEHPTKNTFVKSAVRPVQTAVHMAICAAHLIAARSLSYVAVLKNFF